MDPIPGATEQIDMDAFRREMEELKRTDADIHLPTMNIRDLTEFDAETWRSYRQKKLTISEFNQRRATAVAHGKNTDSRTLFYAYIGNDWYDHYGPPSA
jgi:hypothetical protein